MTRPPRVCRTDLLVGKRDTENATSAGHRWTSAQPALTLFENVRPAGPRRASTRRDEGQRWCWRASPASREAYGARRRGDRRAAQDQEHRDRVITAVAQVGGFQWM